jgi:phosphatidylserine/phosphatidylglycerophosphate/cardiolipin synthase-like enzyme
VLPWAGAPVPLFTPTRAAVRRVRDELIRGTRVHCALDARERPMHCHHEKIVTVDGNVAFVGGIDLTALGGDRFDSSDHPMRGRMGWHDVTTRLRGPAVADVAAHFAARWSEVTGEALEAPPPPPTAGRHELQGWAAAVPEVSPTGTSSLSGASGCGRLRVVCGCQALNRRYALRLRAFAGGIMAAEASTKLPRLATFRIDARTLIAAVGVAPYLCTWPESSAGLCRLGG